MCSGKKVPAGLLTTLFALSVTSVSFCHAGNEVQNKRVEMAAQLADVISGAFVGGAMEVANKKDPVAAPPIGGEQQQQLPTGRQHHQQEPPAQQIIGHGLRYEPGFRGHQQSSTPTNVLVPEPVTEVKSLLNHSTI